MPICGIIPIKHHTNLRATPAFEWIRWPQIKRQFHHHRRRHLHRPPPPSSESDHQQRWTMRDKAASNECGGWLKSYGERIIIAKGKGIDASCVERRCERESIEDVRKKWESRWGGDRPRTDGGVALEGALTDSGLWLFVYELLWQRSFDTLECVLHVHCKHARLYIFYSFQFWSNRMPIFPDYKQSIGGNL